MKTGTHLGSSDFLEPVRKPVEEVLPLLVEAEPQIQLELGLHRPACRTEALLTGQLQNTTAGGREKSL